MQASPIPLDIKKVVTFIYYPTNLSNAVPDGTGFLVGLNSAKDTNRIFPYLVTAKHVLRPSINAWLPLIFLRLNCLDGTSDMVLVPLLTSGPIKNVFIHDDPTVDIAVVPVAPNRKIHDFLLLPTEFITSEADFKNLEIHEGSDVFFTGMFVQHLGEKRNTPITRFGKVALMTDEKIDGVFGKTDLYLMEANAYGGNSGSPVFFQIGMEREGGFVFGGPRFKLAGVMSGSYPDIEFIKTLSVSTNQYVTPNLGISGVVPAYKLKEILFSKELQSFRGE